VNKSLTLIIVRIQFNKGRIERVLKINKNRTGKESVAKSLYGFLAFAI
jgi:hypothetical protein